MPKNQSEHAIFEITEKESLDLGVHIWDEIAKGISMKMREHLIPVVNEVFHKDHPLNATIVFLSTEYAKAQYEDGHAFRTILSDITFQVDGKEIYHLEFQVDRDGKIIIRMLEYDFQIGLQHGAEVSPVTGALHLHFPYYAVIYPDAGPSQPDFLECTLHFQDGSEHVYRVPVIKISDYKLHELFEKRLNMFLPFSLLRFRDRVKGLDKNPSGEDSLKNDLTAFLNELILGLETEFNQGIITRQQHQDYVRLVNLAVKRLLHGRPKLWKEASKVTECKLKFIDDIKEDMKAAAKVELRETVKAEVREELRETVKAEVRAEVTAKVRKEVTAEFENILAQKNAEIAELKRQLSTD